MTPTPAIDVAGLSFRYGSDEPPVLDDIRLALPEGARCLLLGANGAGKTTLLRLLAGRHKIPTGRARVLGREAFEDTTLAADVAFLGGVFPFVADIAVADILRGRSGVDPARRAALLELLDVDSAWRMSRVSDGQRRRVQILLDLERATRVLLIDEVTADLDVLARADLLRLLRAESEARGVTVLYASHVLDGLQAWASHLLFLSAGRVRRLAPIDQVAELSDTTLPALCERWMREDRAAASSARPRTALR